LRPRRLRFLAQGDGRNEADRYDFGFDDPDNVTRVDDDDHEDPSNRPLGYEDRRL
jgi:hypothetical protein